MISLIVPTYNRAYALEKVLNTFYCQKHVTEVVFVDDCSNDNTEQVVKKYQNIYPSIRTVYLKNQNRMGASFGRNRGVEASSNEYILFCDDDEFLEKNYSEVCFKKFQQNNVSIVSGRHFYRNVDEDIDQAIKRFGNGLKKGIVFGNIRFKVYTDSIIEKDISIPFTHGIYLTKKKLILQYGIDPFYAKGNGFREESDFQTNLFVNGHTILVTNETHCVHMNMKEVKTGGQRVSRLKRYFWSVYYTHYFLSKYFRDLKKKLNIIYPMPVAMFLYATAEFYDFFIRPAFLIPNYLKNKLVK